MANKRYNSTRGTVAATSWGAKHRTLLMSDKLEKTSKIPRVDNVNGLTRDLEGHARLSARPLTKIASKFTATSSQQ